MPRCASNWLRHPWAGGGGGGYWDSRAAVATMAAVTEASWVRLDCRAAASVRRLPTSSDLKRAISCIVTGKVHMVEGMYNLMLGDR